MNTDPESCFTAGAYSYAVEHGMTDADARALAVGLCKLAARGRRYDDEEDDTWWSRNKGWALPTGIGALAFLIGADAGRNGRMDRGYLSGAASQLAKRLNALLGVPSGPVWDAATKITDDKYKGMGEKKRSEGPVLPSDDSGLANYKDQ